MPTQHSVPRCPAPSVSGPFSAAKHGGGRGWKQGNWDQHVCVCVCVPLPLSVLPWQHIYFSLSPPEMWQTGGGPSPRRWQEPEMMDMKMSFFFFFFYTPRPRIPPPPPLVENVVSYLVRVWFVAKWILMLKHIQPPSCVWIHSRHESTAHISQHRDKKGWQNFNR